MFLIEAPGGAWGVSSLLDAERVFFPAPSRPLLLLQVEHPHGTSVDETVASVREIETFLFHPGFPVDLRHNAKIRREDLKSWAESEAR